MKNYQIKALSTVLKNRGFSQSSANLENARLEWNLKPCGIRAMLARDKDTTRFFMCHSSGYTFYNEIMNIDSSYDLLLSSLERNKFSLPALDSRAFLAGPTEPANFIISDKMVENASVWPEIAKNSSSGYTWRKVNKPFEFKIRGTSKFELAKNDKFGYRTVGGKTYAIKPGMKKEYVVGKDALALIDKNSKALVGKPPALDKPDTKKAPTKKAPTKKAATKKDVTKKDVTKKDVTKKDVTKKDVTNKEIQNKYAKEQLANLASYLEMELGAPRVRSAKLIKKELSPYMRLSRWPTKKSDLLQLIHDEVGESIYSILRTVKEVEANLSKFTKAELEAHAQLRFLKFTLLRNIMRINNIVYPKGSTDDPNFWNTVSIEIVKKLGADETIRQIAAVVSKSDLDNNKLLKKMADEDKKLKEGTVRRPIGIPKVFSKINFSSGPMPKEYQLNEGTLVDGPVTRSLKIVLKELFDFAGSQLEPANASTHVAFKQGRAVIEYLRVKTSPSDHSYYSSEQFLEAFLKKYSNKSLPVHVKSYKRSNEGKPNDKIAITLAVKDASDVKMQIDIHPKDPFDSITKHNLLLSKANLGSLASILRESFDGPFNITIFVDLP